MPDNSKFFEIVKPLFGKFTESQVKALDFLLDKSKAFTDVKHKAYFMATIFHETGKTMEPINEWGKGKGRPYGVAKKYKDIPPTVGVMSSLLGTTTMRRLIRSWV